MTRSLQYVAFFVGLAAVVLGRRRLHRLEPAGAGDHAARRRLLPDGRAGTAPLPPGHVHPGTRRGGPARSAGRAWATGSSQLHPSLRNAVRLRIEGERVGLPGPALTPYLAGLLVLLGMLGTFLGMVVTLNGTGIGAGERVGPAGHPRLPGRPGQGPGAGLRHLARGRGRVGDAGPHVRLVPARPAAGRAAARHADRDHLACLLAGPSARGVLQAAAAAGPGDARAGRPAAGHDGGDGTAEPGAERAPARQPGQLPRQGRGRVCGPGRLRRPLA